MIENHLTYVINNYFKYYIWLLLPSVSLIYVLLFEAYRIPAKENNDPMYAFFSYSGSFEHCVYWFKKFIALFGNSKQAKIPLLLGIALPNFGSKKLTAYICSSYFTFTYVFEFTLFGDLLYIHNAHIHIYYIPAQTPVRFDCNYLHSKVASFQKVLLLWSHLVLWLAVLFYSWYDSYDKRSLQGGSGRSPILFLHLYKVNTIELLLYYVLA